jgi:uncharacterized membrane protein
VRVSEDILIDAPRKAVWDYALDPARIPEYMEGFSRWESKTRKTKSVGARYALRLSVGSADVGSLVEIVEWDAPNDMSWTSITGLDHRFRVRMRDEEGGTRVTMKLSYQAPGGVLALIADWISQRRVGRILSNGLEQLRLEIESG